jgi:hypothetical protein
VGTSRGEVHRYTVSAVRSATGKAEYRATAPLLVATGGKRVMQMEALPEIDLLLVLVGESHALCRSSSASPSPDPPPPPLQTAP